MKKIIFDDLEQIQVEEDLPIDVEGKHIFYVVGAVFDSSFKDLTRKMIEDESLKEYKEIIRKVVVARNEKVFLHDFFNRNHHHIIDLINIINYHEMTKIVNLSEIKNVSTLIGFIPSLFVKEKSEYIVVFNTKNPEQKKYIKLNYVADEEKREFIDVLLDDGFEVLFCENAEIFEKNYTIMNNILDDKNDQKEEYSYFEMPFVECVDDVMDTNSEKTLSRLTGFLECKSET